VYLNSIAEGGKEIKGGFSFWGWKVKVCKNGRLQRKQIIVLYQYLQSHDANISLETFYRLTIKML